MNNLKIVLSLSCIVGLILFYIWVDNSAYNRGITFEKNQWIQEQYKQEQQNQQRKDLWNVTWGKSIGILNETKEKELLELDKKKQELEMLLEELEDQSSERSDLQNKSLYNIYNKSLPK